MRTAILFLVCSCAGTQATRPGPAEQALGARLEAVLYRGAAPGRVSDLRVGRAPGGSVRVEPARGAGGGREDAAVAAEVRARLAAEPMLLDRVISVDVDEGVARLQGAVGGRQQAARAVLEALRVEGVRAVETTLSWIPPADLARLRSHHR